MKVYERLKSHHDGQTSFKTVLRPSSVFSIRIPADLREDLDTISTVTHINRNTLVTILLFYCVANIDDVLSSIFQGLDDSDSDVLAFNLVTCSQSVTDKKRGSY
jgi:hypothetical protein